MEEKNNQRTRKRTPSTGLLQGGKLPPQAVDVEEAIIGAIMIEKGALLEVIDFLTAKDFYKENKDG